MERALELNIIQLVESTRMLALFPPYSHPEKYQYWQTRRDRLRRKREILLAMRERGNGAPYERADPLENS